MNDNTAIVTIFVSGVLLIILSLFILCEYSYLEEKNAMENGYEQVAIDGRLLWKKEK